MTTQLQLINIIIIIIIPYGISVTQHKLAQKATDLFSEDFINQVTDILITLYYSGDNQ